MTKKNLKKSILTSYATLIESKNTNEKTALFFAFSFMQAWTMYSEIISFTTRKNVNIVAFWVKVTPGILALMSQVCLHYYSNKYISYFWRVN